jgi:hypothetical protein
MAVAVLGTLAVEVFAGSLAEQLAVPQVPQSLREAMLREAPRLAEARVPAQAGELRPALETVLARSFVASYRVVMLVAAGLAVLSAVCAWVTAQGLSSKLTSTAPSGGSSRPPTEA